MAQSTDTGSGEVSKETLVIATRSDAEQFAETDERSYDADFNFLNPNAAGSESSSVSETEGTDGSEKQDDRNPGLAKQEKEKKETTIEEEKSVEVSQATVGGGGNASWEVRFKGLQSSMDRKVSELSTSIQEKDRQLEELRKIGIAKEEFEKAPIAFLTRYAPDVAAKLDPRKIVLDKLREEFKTDIENGETFNPAEQYQEGTFSYKFASREHELTSEINSQKQQALAERAAQTRAQNETYLAAKVKVMKERGLTEEQYEKEIVGFSKTMAATLPEMIAKIRYYDQDVKKAVDQALKDLTKGNGNGKRAPVSASSAGGDNEDMPDHLKELHNEFGD